jgi:hypothetical protein
MKLQEIKEREAREAEKQERAAARTRTRFKKLVSGAVMSFDNCGHTCFTFPDGQIFKCRGPLPESIYGHAPKWKTIPDGQSRHGGIK